MRESAVQIHNLGKRYALPRASSKNASCDLLDLWALKGVSLRIERGSIVGIIGRNGAGKTTLLNLIAGTLSLSEGSITVNGKVLGLFNLGVGFQDELSGKENIFLNAAILGARRQEVEEKLEAIIEFSELGDFIHMPLGSYSQGMRLRLGFSIIANLEFDILVIDEVLAVGDALFQSKCFQRLMDFKRAGKTMIMSSQNFDLVRRLCDTVILFEHGRLVFDGEAEEGIRRYQHTIATERFYVGQAPGAQGWVENTKKWAQDLGDWNKKLGSKEAVIESVRLMNKFGLTARSIKTRDPLTIKVVFRILNVIKEPHFGVAIFRSDGVYCYGPNTAYDGAVIQMIESGRGSFVLKFASLLLAPGEYRVSVAIWDKEEALPFDYHNGYYPLFVHGYLNANNELLNIPYKIGQVVAAATGGCIFDNDMREPVLWQEGSLKSVELLDNYCHLKDTIITNEPLIIRVLFSALAPSRKGRVLWLGIYREDGIFCQSFTMPLKEGVSFDVVLAHLPLLPGHYSISVGIWDDYSKKFLMRIPGAKQVKVVFNRQDHGTVYLAHTWRWAFSKRGNT